MEGEWGVGLEHVVEERSTQGSKVICVEAGLFGRRGGKGV